MVICKDKPKSFKEFKETALIHKFGTVGFVLLYGYRKYGYLYGIRLQGTNKELALKESYRLLFTDVDEFEAQFVQVSHDSVNGSLKMPLACNFFHSFRIN
jgi:hypothetical protein